MILTLGNLKAYAMVTHESFPDIPTTHWASGYINRLEAMDAIQGYPDGEFHPNDTLTIEQFLKIIALILAHEEKFYDEEVPDFIVAEGDRWSQPYIDYLYDLGIIQSKTSFHDVSFDGNMTREWMAELSVATDRYLDETYISVDLEQVEEEIRDRDSITPDFKDDVLNCYAMGILTGYTNGTFKPQEILTRAEASAVAIRIIDISERKPFVGYRPYSISTLLSQEKYQNKFVNNNPAYRGATSFEFNDNGTITFYYKFKNVDVNYTLDREKSAMIIGALEAVLPVLLDDQYACFTLGTDSDTGVISYIALDFVENEVGYGQFITLKFPLRYPNNPLVKGFQNPYDFSITLLNLYRDETFDSDYFTLVGDQAYDSRYMKIFEYFMHGVFGSEYQQYTDHLYDRFGDGSVASLYKNSHFPYKKGESNSIGDYYIDFTYMLGGNFAFTER